MKKVISIVFLCLFTTCNFAASDRYMVEQNLTSIAQHAVDAMYGENNFIIRIQANMTESRYNVKYTQESKPKQSAKKAKEESVYILPGVPALKNIAPSNLNQLPFDSVTTMSEPRLQQLLVYVLANKNYPKAQSRRVEDTIKTIIGFKEERGDKIKMDYQIFYENPNKESQSITIVPSEEKLITIQNIFYSLFTLLLIVAVIVYYISQRRLLSKENSAAGPSINVNPNLELPKGFRGGGSGGAGGKLQMAGDIKQYFDFVTDENIDNLIYLVRSQNLNPEYVALMASFLSSDLSAQLIQSLPIKDQADIVSGIAEHRLANRELLDKLDKKMKHDLECFVGGESKLAAVVDLLSVSDRKSILMLLKKNNMSSYKKVRGFITIFDDLLLLSEREIQLVLSELNLEKLALALVSVDQQVFDFVIENLTPGARDMVKQYLQLKSENAKPKQIEDAQDDILTVVKTLEKAGQIDLKSKLAKA